ncbi:MAG TPA: TIGR01777 family oxidoreductase [Verrucomicrobiae bacterium]|nr:TIGR01777 family oxidoreductase [Verrucomicrobiae bacterium]
MNTPRKIVLAGGTGFLGQVLGEWFAAKGWPVVVFTRHPGNQERAREVRWDGLTLGPWVQELENAEAVINLSGRSVNCRYGRRNRQEIMNSRVIPTRLLGHAIAGCSNPPKVWLNASTATIYKNTRNAGWDEQGEIDATPEAKDAFSIDVAVAWEQAFHNAVTPGTRKVVLRTAMVLGQAKNSVFPTLRKLARARLGGTMASGTQFVSWIHHADFCRAVDWVIEHEEFSGPVNLVAPRALTNREMMQHVREAGGMSWGLPAPLWLLEIGAFFMRTETELIIKSRRAVPRRLLDSGFEFRFADFAGAIRDLEQGRPR